MRLTKTEAWLIVFSAIMLILGSTILIFPRIAENLITGFASIGSFSVAVSVLPASVIIELDNRTQLDTIIVNGSNNITIGMQVIYSGDGLVNMSVEIPVGFEYGFNWYINESGILKDVTVNGTLLTWEANLSAGGAKLYFEVPPPDIISEVISSDEESYDKTIIIRSYCPLYNASANVTISPNFTHYHLYLLINQVFVDKTIEYSLQIMNGTASFSGFNMSNKTFRLESFQDAELTEETQQESNLGFFLTNRTPAPEFSVSPRQLSIMKKVPSIFQEQIILRNPSGQEKDFTITSTNAFIKEVSTQFVIPANSSKSITIEGDTAGLAPGKYIDYIYIRSGNYEEKIPIALELFLLEEVQKPMPRTEQPSQISMPRPDTVAREEPEYQKQKLSVLSMIVIAAGFITLIVSIMLLFIIKRGPRYKGDMVLESLESNK